MDKSSPPITTNGGHWVKFWFLCIHMIFQSELKVFWTRSTRPIDAKLWKKLCLWIIFNIIISLYQTPLYQRPNISDILKCFIDNTSKTFDMIDRIKLPAILGNWNFWIIWNLCDLIWSFQYSYWDIKISLYQTPLYQRPNISDILKCFIDNTSKTFLHQFQTRSTRPIDAKLWKKLCLWIMFNIYISLPNTPHQRSKYLRFIRCVIFNIKKIWCNI